MALHEITTTVDPLDENDSPEDWRIEFNYDFSENEVTFLQAYRGDSTVGLEWEDFLKEVGRAADGDFVEGIYDQAMEHIENLVDDGGC